jgi:hypothetical protein
MLRPTKHTSLRTAPISIGAAILNLLQVQGRASFIDIDEAVKRGCGDISQHRIQEVLILLYAVGALEYAEEMDAFVPPADKGKAA